MELMAGEEDFAGGDLFMVGHVRRGRNCRAYTPGTHARKDEDRLLLEFPCNPTRTCTV
jgi:hypothetical protein